MMNKNIRTITTIEAGLDLALQTRCPAIAYIAVSAYEDFINRIYENGQRILITDLNRMEAKYSTLSDILQTLKTDKTNVKGKANHDN